MPTPRYLLMQVRNLDDPMRDQEIACFARGLACETSDIARLDLLAAVPTRREVAAADVILFGGSGDYSAAGDSPWLHRTLDALREVHELNKPTFASCWGFQALSRALGGRCIHDPPKAELGTVELHLTPAGKRDPVFGNLPPIFTAQAGHQDHVVDLPPGAVLLASSGRVRNQAFTFAGKPIYCTQFHPELSRCDLAARVRQYPTYVERIAGVPIEEFLRTSCRETPEANGLLHRFVEHVFG
jgi:GMP synthase (glutamine-hydrolysing)